MADYTAVVRTNYFHVTDEEKYRELLGMLESDYFEDFTEMKDGRALHGFGSYGPISDDNDAFYNGIREILPDDEAFMQFEVGNEKLRYVVGAAIIVTKKEGVKTLNIDDEAKKYAKSVLGEGYKTVTEY